MSKAPRAPAARPEPRRPPTPPHGALPPAEVFGRFVGSLAKLESAGRPAAPGRPGR